MTRRLNLVNDTSLVRGKVVSNYDPENLGRVTVRIPSYHGIPGVSNKWIPDELLPQCNPGNLLAAGNDMGQRIVPVVGSMVYVIFEEGDLSKPVYFGGIPLMIGKTKHYNLNDPTVLNGDVQVTTSDKMMDITDVHSQSSQGVLFKSLKGFTIYFDDTDGHEVVKIIDQSGQMIKMESLDPVITRRGTDESSLIQSRITIKNSDTVNIVVENTTIDINVGDTVLQVDTLTGFTCIVPSDVLGD